MRSIFLQLLFFYVDAKAISHNLAVDAPMTFFLCPTLLWIVFLVLWATPCASLHLVSTAFRQRTSGHVGTAENISHFFCASPCSGPGVTPSIDAVCSQTSPRTIWSLASSSLSCDACFIFVSFLNLPCCGVRMTMCLSRCLAAVRNKMWLRTTEVQNRKNLACTNQHLPLVLARTLCSKNHPNALSSYVFASFILNRRKLACVLEHVD